MKRLEFYCQIFSAALEKKRAKLARKGLKLITNFRATRRCHFRLSLSLCFSISLSLSLSLSHTHTHTHTPGPSHGNKSGSAQVKTRWGFGGGGCKPPSGVRGRAPENFKKHAFFNNSLHYLGTVQALKTLKQRDALSLFAIAQKWTILFFKLCFCTMCFEYISFVLSKFHVILNF